MTTANRFLLCRDVENDRDQAVIRFNGLVECFHIKPNHETEANHIFIIADDDGANPICRIEFFSDFKSNQNE